LARWRGRRLGSERVRSRGQHRAVRPSRLHTTHGRGRASSSTDQQRGVCGW
jgi:hypothetical protein